MPLTFHQHPAMRLIALLIFSLLASCSQHLGRPQTAAPPPVVSSYQRIVDVPFTPAGWPQPLLADIYRPSGPGPYPSVLLIHGGAWKRGDRAQVQGLAERIAARGYLVMNTTYRLVPQYVFPAQLQDVQQALRWMRSPAGAQQGIDPDRIGSFGYSAGGHLAALLGHIAKDPLLGDPAQTLKTIVAGGTPAELARFKNGRLVPAFIGGPWAEKSASYLAASPVSHVRPGDPPVFIYHASLDGLVPYEQAEIYKAALDRAGVTNELFVIRGHGHISGFFADGAAVEAALEFMDRHLR